MTSLDLTSESIPSLDGKTAIITGGSSGIGLSTTNLLISKNCRTYILDLNPPTTPLSSHATFLKCDTTSWSDLVRAFAAATNDPENRSRRKIDIAIANAGVSETVEHWLDDAFEDGGEGVLKEPVYKVLDVNLRGVLNFVKLAVRTMKMGGAGNDAGAGDDADVANGNTASRGSIVITSSATAYAPEQSLPVYSASKLALIGLMRALRSTLPASGITINALAPAATVTNLLPQNLAAPLMAAGLPVSSPDMVARAVVFSAVGMQKRRVEAYGKDDGAEVEGRWNGRTILTLGERYTEVEEMIAELRPKWLGDENARLTRKQQAAKDFRGI